MHRRPCLLLPLVFASAVLGSGQSVPAKKAGPDAPPAGEPGRAPDGPLDWRAGESGILSGHVQLTFPDQFVKAGEAYFNRAGTWIVFQAVPRAEQGRAPGPDVYSMYVAQLKLDAERNIVGMETPIRISPEGSANTCGFFNPTRPMEVIFGSTMTAPSGKDSPGYQRGTRSYRWAFPAEMDVVRVRVPAILASGLGTGPGGIKVSGGTPSAPERLISGPAYDAECAFDPSGRYIVYATQKGMDDTTRRPKIALEVFDTNTGTSMELTKPEGYNGGPFFSADGSMICMRADRKGDDLLQVFVLTLDREADGTIKGVRGEYQVTDNQHVNWAPFFHPSGEYLVYATSEVGHDNYEVFAVEVPRAANGFAKPARLKHKRVTHASGFDGLPVFSHDGNWMMWTSQRGGKVEGEARPSSQLWVGKVERLSPLGGAAP